MTDESSELISAAAKACLEESEGSKTPGVFIQSYCRKLAQESDLTKADIEEVERRALAEALARLQLARNPPSAVHESSNWPATCA